MENNLWISVDNSSLILAYKYDSETKELDVQFKSNGAKYRYSNIPSIIGDAIKHQEKIGKFIKLHVIDAGKPYDRLN